MTSILQTLLASFPTPVSNGWNGWDGAWSASALSGYTTRTDFGTSFGGAYDIAFSTDGTKGYVCGSASGSIGKITEWALATPYSFTGASNTATLDPTSSGTFVTALHFSPDGTKLVYVDWSNNRMGSVDLSTAWSISSAGTATVSSTSLIPSGSIGNTFLTPDATKLFVTNRNSDIREFSLSTPGDVTSMSFVSSTTVGSTNWYGIYFSGDGLTVYLGTRDTNLRSYVLTSPYDLSSAGSVQTLSITTPPNTYGVRLTNLGQTLWIGGGASAAGAISSFAL